MGSQENVADLCQVRMNVKRSRPTSETNVNESVLKARKLKLGGSLVPSHQNHVFRWRESSVSFAVNVAFWQVQLAIRYGVFLYLIGLRDVIRNALANGRAIGQMLNNLAEKAAERVKALGLAFLVWADRKRAQSRQDFVKTLKLLLIAWTSRIQYIRSGCSANSITIGMHF